MIYELRLPTEAAPGRMPGKLNARFRDLTLSGIFAKSTRDGRRFGRSGTSTCHGGFDSDQLVYMMTTCSTDMDDRTRKWARRSWPGVAPKNVRPSDWKNCRVAKRGVLDPNTRQYAPDAFWEYMDWRLRVMAPGFVAGHQALAG